MDFLSSYLTILTTALPAYRFPVLAMLFFHYFYADAAASWCTPHVSYMLSYFFPLLLSSAFVCYTHAIYVPSCPSIAKVTTTVSRLPVGMQYPKVV